MIGSSSLFRSLLWITVIFLLAAFIYLSWVTRILSPYRDMPTNLEAFLEFSVEPEGDGLPISSIEELQALEFKPVSAWPSRGEFNPMNVYWFRFSDTDLFEQANSKDSVIELREGRRFWIVRSISLFVKDGDEFGLSHRIDSESKRDEKVNQSGGYVLSVDHNPSVEGEIEYWIRIEPRNYFDPDFRFWKEGWQRDRFEAKRSMVFLLSLGMLLAVLLVVGIFAIRQGSPLLGSYFGYLALVVVILSGSWQAHTGNWIFWPQGSFSQFAPVILLAATLAYAFLFSFTRLFLGIDRKQFEYRLLKIAHVANVAVLFVVFAVLMLFDDTIALDVIAIREISFAALSVGIGLSSLRRGRKEAYVYILSFSLMVVVTVVHHLIRLGVVSEWPHPLSELPVVDVGVLFGAFFLGFAAADRMRGVQLERDEAKEEALRNLERLKSVEEEARIGLEKKVEERTRDLSFEVERSRNAEVALEKALRSSEDANQTKAAFLANMSHELRTPLNAVIGYAQLMESPSYGQSKTRKAISVIRKSGQHLLELINDVLNLSKVEAGRVEAEPEGFNLIELLEELITMVQVNAEQKGLAITLERSEDLACFVDGDRRLLRQILINLLGNAIKFTDAGRVTLKAFPSRFESAHVEFEIVDTGIGIADDALERIFEPFAQSGNEGAKGKGTGLGLAISRKLARAMGGDIVATSAIGEGSTFRLTLPLPPSSDTPEAKKTSEEEDLSSIIGYEGRVRSILIVDDEASNRAVERDLLESLGFDVVEASSGEEALNFLLETVPDLVVMDIQMPGMNGLEATSRIRATDRLKDLPVVACSASIMGESRKRCFAAGCDAFLEKPLLREVLIRTLSECFEIEWKRRKADQDEAVKPAEDVRFPSMDILSQLRSHAASGYVEGVRSVLKSISELEENGKYQGFTTLVESKLQEFDLDAIVALADEEDH